MTNLQRLYDEQGQSPWLDNLTRDLLSDGTLATLVAGGIRGVTANPTILTKGIRGSCAYQEQISRLVGEGRAPEDVYWEIVLDDVVAALDLLRPVHESSGGRDGFVSVELAPDLAYHVGPSVRAAVALHDRVRRPNLLVKIPATRQGVDAIQAATAAGYSINVTLIFSLERYQQVIDAYLSGLESFAAMGGDLATVHSVASFFVSRVDTMVNSRLDWSSQPEAPRLRGTAAVAQAKLAYAIFRRSFSGPRWEFLQRRGATVQRPLWASTSMKDPLYPDTRYVDELIGPDTVTTLPESTIVAFNCHGAVRRTVDAGVGEAAGIVAALKALGIDLEQVGEVLEQQGVDLFRRSFSELLALLTPAGIPAPGTAAAS